MFILGVLACSSRDNPEERTGVNKEHLTSTELGRILSFEGTLGSSGDWVKSAGTVASSTAHASTGTRSMVMSGAYSISVTSTALSALGSVGTKMSLDVWLPSALAGQTNKGNIQAFFNSGTLQLSSYATSNVQLTSLTPGQFSRIDIPLDSTLKTKLSQSGYSDLTIKFTFNLADVAHQTFVDNLAFSPGSTGTGGSSGTGGTRALGGTTSIIGSGGTRPTGGTTSIGGTPSLGGTTAFVGNGGAPVAGGAPNNGGGLGLGGAIVYTGGTPASGGLSSAVESSLTGGAPGIGGAASGGVSTANTSATGSTGSTTGGSTSTGGTGATGGGTAYTFSFQLPAGVNRNQVVFATTGGDLWVDDGVKAVNDAGYASVSAVNGGRVNRIGVGAQVQNVWSAGDVQLANNAIVNGSLYTTGALVPQAGAQVLGTTTQQADIGPLQTISWAVTFPNNTQQPVNLTTTQTLTPGSYPDYSIKTGAQLSLSSGTYFFKSLMIEPGGTLQISSTSGPVFIYLQNSFTQRGTVYTGFPNSRVLFGLAGTSPVSIGSSLNGILVAPAASVSLETLTGSTHVGAVFAKSITVHQNTTTRLQGLQPSNFCGPNDACSSFCACPVGSYPCNGSSNNCDTGLTCDSSNNTCTCQTNCANKHCGDDPSDGCGGLCPTLCTNGQTGCTGNLQCPAGSECIIGGGPRKGFAPGTNICLPTICEEQDPRKANCGVGSADCGPCPACVPNCNGKTCGDDGCGGSCGSVGSNQACVAGNVISAQPLAQHSPNFPPPLQVVSSQSAVPGTIPGNFTVTPRGTPEYSMTIEVPPGREGVEPKLSIVHTGDMGNGILGQGWALRGLSRIERCRKTIQPDGVAKQVSLTADDALCLDGQRLVADVGKSGMPAHKYHTEVESFKLVQSFGDETDGNGKYVGPSGFTVWTKEGLKLTYGQSEGYARTISGQSLHSKDSSSTVTTRGVKRIWNLSKVEDHAGNSMTIYYTQFVTPEVDTTEIVPKSIYYGAQATSGEISVDSFLSNDNIVEFEYENRPDPRHHYVLGQRNYSTWRLKTINTYAGVQPVRTYNVSYTNAGYGEQRVGSVQACGSASDGSVSCMPASTFTYNQSTGGQTVMEPAFEQSNTLVAILDADGDGSDDLLVSKDWKTFTLNTHYASGSGVNSPPAHDSFDVTHPIIDYHQADPWNPDWPDMQQLRVIDANGDGRDDLILIRVGYKASELVGTLVVLYSTGTGFSATEYPTSCFQGGHVGDFDGDGRKDYICFKNEDQSAYVTRIVPSASDANGGGWQIGEEVKLPKIAPPLTSGVSVFDVDGDGADDLFYVTDSADKPAQVLRNTNGGPITAPLGNVSWQSAGLTPTEAPIPQRCSEEAKDYCTFPDPNTQEYQTGFGDGFSRNMAVVDVNGDGLKDVYYIGRRDGVQSLPSCDNTCGPIAQPILWLNTGRGFVPSSVAIPTDTVFSAAFPLVFDYDNDGREDLVDPIYGFMLRATVRGTLEWTPIAENFTKLGLVYDKTFMGYPMSVADLNGDGSADWIISHLDQGGIRWSDPTKNGRLSTIHDGLGKVIKIGYDGENTGAIQDYSPPSRTYENRLGFTANSDVTRLRRVAPLVSMYSEFQSFADSTGAELPRAYNASHVFTYTDANVGLNGRGWYGFLEISEQVLDSPAGNVFRTINTYHNNTEFWNAGKLDVSRETFADIAQTAWHPAHDRMVESSYTWNRYSTSIGKEQFTGLDWKRVTVREGEDTVVRAVTTYEYDDGVGNVTVRNTVTGVPVQGGWSNDTTQVYTSYAIDLANWLVVSPEFVTESDQIGANRENHNYLYGYYPNGLLQSITRELDHPTLQRTTTLTRDPTTSVVTKIETAGISGNKRNVRIDYDSQQRFPSAYRREELVTEVQHDPRTGQLLTSYDPNGVVNQWQYDAFGRVRSAIGPTETSATTYHFGANDTLFSIPGAMTVATLTTGRGVSRYSNYNLDALGQVQGAVQSGVGYSFLVQEFSRDWAERVVSASVPYAIGDTPQGSYTYTYDAFGRVASITAPDQRTTQIDYMSNVNFPNGQDELFSNPNDFATEAVVRAEPNGLQEISVVNFRNQPVRVIQSKASDNVSAAQALSGVAGAMSHYTYGLFGRLSNVTDPDDETTTISYDNIGRRTGVSNPTTGARIFSLNDFDEVSSDVDANGNNRCYSYDSLGRLVQLTKGASDGTCDPMADLIASWTYDGSGDNELGKLVKSFRAISPGSTSGTTIRYSYEPRPSGEAPNVGRLKSVEQDMPNLAKSLTTTLDYSGPWVSKLHYPTAGGDDFALTYSRDSIGTVTGVSSNGVSYWQLTQVDQGQRIKQEQFGSGTVTTYDYYSPGAAPGQCNFPNSVSCMPGALHAMTTALPSDTAGNPTKNLQYAYDKGAYLSAITDVRKGASEEYTYDVYGRVIAKGNFSGPAFDRVTYWHYTPGGDIKSVSTGDVHANTGVVQTYTYQTIDVVIQHQLRSITDTQNHTLELYYDGNGNTTTRTGMGVPNGNQTIEYNDFDMPIRITDGQNSATTLEYDADKQRVAKRGPTDTTLYVNDLYDCTGPSSQTSFACTEQHFKIFSGGKQVAEVTRDQFNVDTTKYIHSDHLGSATLVTDATGGLLESRAYDTFGQPSVDLTNNAIKTGFTGHEHDADLGFINMKGRLYDPTTRRFLTPDPLVADPFNPQGLNRYSYVTNNPLNLVDPSGFESGVPDRAYAGSGGTVAPNPSPVVQSGDTLFMGDVVKGPANGYSDPNSNGNQSYVNDQSAGEPKPDSEGLIDRFYVAPKGGGSGGDVQALANQNRSSNPGAGTSTGSVPQSTDNRRASPAPGTITSKPVAAMGTGVIALARPLVGPALDDIIAALARAGLRSAAAVGAGAAAISASLGLLATSDSDRIHLANGDVKFPTARELAKKLGVGEKEFHGDVKPGIKSDFLPEMKRIGTDNPDIGIGPTGDIILRNPQTGKTVDTGVPLDSYAR